MTRPAAVFGEEANGFFVGDGAGLQRRFPFSFARCFPAPGSDSRRRFAPEIASLTFAGSFCREHLLSTWRRSPCGGVVPGAIDAQTRGTSAAMERFAGRWREVEGSAGGGESTVGIDYYLCHFITPFRRLASLALSVLPRANLGSIAVWRTMPYRPPKGNLEIWSVATLVSHRSLSAPLPGVHRIGRDWPRFQDVGINLDIIRQGATWRPN